MAKNVLEWLESTEAVKSGYVVFEDMAQQITFGEVAGIARKIGTGLIRELGGRGLVGGAADAPVAVFASRQAQTPVLFLGVVYSGRAYAPIDASLPQARIAKILENLSPAAILVDAASREALEALGVTEGKKLLVAEELMAGEADDELLGMARRQMVITDPLYIIYTSGSTGNPKGVMTSHQSLMNYIEAYGKVMGICEEDILGNQSPLDYIAAIRDIYLPLRYGCHTAIIPKEYFMEPDRLFGFLNERNVTSIGWSVSALTVPLSLGAFEESTLTTLRKICFSGSVMPCKALRVWQEHLPDALFVNQYGPTEATASCTYYVVDHKVEDDEVLPIGIPYENYHVFLLTENGTEPAPGEQGEICVSGPQLALGYYNDPERTNASFELNPLHRMWPERMYRSGDIGSIGEDGNLLFHGRMDRQIKHMGHRVELDEVEFAANQQDGVAESCCLYQKEKEALHLFYAGELEKKELVMALRKELPGFMVPRKVKKLDALPKLPNGKIDMKGLRDLF